ncbi:hypothetical protein AVEN_157655-1 [Araneus ventricosus]|uniref:Uncharacterized protein n=1 Tax=Araneus ventricosus TaxID=182803 RepID=A0A4Y2S422_ARAVE|nr:hypothetical protein AVEN_157655-1 [Araneus ventricosus]
MQTSEGPVLLELSQRCPQGSCSPVDIPDFETPWQTKSYRYSGLKEFIYKHLKKTLRSSLQTRPEKVSEKSENWRSLRTGQKKINCTSQWKNQAMSF